MNKYKIDVFYSKEDGGYIANVPDLKYCSAFGETRAEAEREVKIAMRAWLAAASANHKPIPEPKQRERVGVAGAYAANNLHVVPRGDRWAVVAQSESIKVHKTQQEAIETAKQAASPGGRIVIHNRTGQIKRHVIIPRNLKKS